MLYCLKITLIFLFANLISAQTIDTSKINNFINKIRGELRLKTALSLSVVQGNKKILSKGYGYINIDEKIEAAPNSPYYIASSTKSFTATLLEILSEKDTVNIDKSITNYLPEFDFENKYLNSHLITMRDLLTHRSGILSIPSVVRTAYTGQHSFEELISLYKNADFTTREFKYGNDGYVFISLILDQIYHKPWQELMRENIFDPLEMKNSSCYVTDYDNSLLCAYRTNENEIDQLTFLKRDNTMHAAGGIVSTADDLGNWLIFNINEGKFNNHQILSDRKINEMHSSQISCNKIFWKYHRYAYGLGWYLSEYNDEILIHHFGGFEGARSHISFMPQYDIGVAVLTNDDGLGYYTVDLIADYIYNTYLGKEAEAIANKDLLDIIEKNRKKEISDLTDDIASSAETIFDYDDLVGSYVNDDFGIIEISNLEDLKLEFGNLISELVPNSEERFSVPAFPFNSEVSFRSIDGNIKELILYGPIKILFNRQ